MNRKAVTEKKFWRIRVSAAVLALSAVTTVVKAQGPQRPISDFISAQGTFCFPDGGGGCIVFVPPVKNFIGWADQLFRYAVSVAAASLRAWMRSSIASSATSSGLVSRWT